AWVADVVLPPAPAGDVALEPSALREIPPELAWAKGATASARHEVTIDLALAGLGPGAISGTPEIGVGYLVRGARFSVGPHLSYGSTDRDIYGLPVALQRWTATLLALRRLALRSSELQLGAGLGVAAIRERVGAEAPRLGWAPALSAA